MVEEASHVDGAREGADRCTQDFVDAIEDHARGDPARALIYANSAIAAAMIVMDRHGIDRDMAATLLKTVWLGDGEPPLDA